MQNFFILLGINFTYFAHLPELSIVLEMDFGSALPLNCLCRESCPDIGMSNLYEQHDKYVVLWDFWVL